MGIKHTYEEVKSSFEKEGYTLISDSYVNNKTKLECVCPKGHTCYIPYNYWGDGVRCVPCSIEIRSNKRKLSIETVREYFEKEGYVLLSTEYKNNHTKLLVRCPEGHETLMLHNNFQQGSRCSLCSPNSIPDKNIIREAFEQENYILLNDYVDSSTKMDFICSNGHKHSMTWSSWRNGVRCLYCSGLSKPTIEEIAGSFEEAGYTLLSTEYINSRTKLDYICDKGHTHAITWGAWKEGQRCFYCVGTPKLTIDFIREEFAKRNHILLSTAYENNYSPLEYICPNGHQHTTVWGTFRDGHGCPDCAIISISGPNHYNYKGGYSDGDYCAVWQDKEYKYEIRERDGHKCLNPYCTSKDPTKLAIHHINYDKQDCHFKNLITVCNSCNSKANHDRDWHQSWYQALLHNRYGYIYKH